MEEKFTLEDNLAKLSAIVSFIDENYLDGNSTPSNEDATSLGVALHWAEELEMLNDMYEEEMISIAQKDAAFEKYVANWEAKIGARISESNHPDTMLAGLAEEYLTEKYTKAMYKVIGEHIWEWCD